MLLRHKENYFPNSAKNEVSHQEIILHIDIGLKLTHGLEIRNDI